jgi:nucleoside 2-deoxyribosyltransferase
MKYKVYLAGPDVFRPDAKERGKSLVDLVSHWDMEGLYPLDNEIDLTGDKVSDGRKIALANMDMIQKCDAVLANLEPFRGPSADVGTVWECAYAKGLGKIVCGYSYRVAIDYKQKVLGKIPHDGMIVEDFGVWDNIMLVHSLDIQDHNIRNVLEQLKTKLDRLTLTTLSK